MFQIWNAYLVPRICVTPIIRSQSNFTQHKKYGNLSSKCKQSVTMKYSDWLSVSLHQAWERANSNESDRCNTDRVGDTCQPTPWSHVDSSKQLQWNCWSRKVEIPNINRHTHVYCCYSRPYTPHHAATKAGNRKCHVCWYKTLQHCWF
jgi:hypothetical protein